MAIINKGTSFSNGEQLTADKLNNLVDQAEFNSAATDGATTFVNSSGQIAVADSGISAGKLATNAVETAKIKDANVTKAKIENVANMKALGNTSGSAAAPQEVAILDENDMSSDSDTSLATQQSIKAYVDAGTATQIGVGQTWQGVTRALDGTSYTNSTGKPIMVKGQFHGDTDNHDIDIKITPSGGSEISMKFATSTNSGGGVSSNGSIIIPNNTAYRFTKSGDAVTSFSFNELR
tara:strand:- start:38 stop:745 length:708 start_codon:yes stop_codon:yes gene_type:complete